MEAFAESPGNMPYSATWLSPRCMSGDRHFSDARAAAFELVGGHVLPTQQGLAFAPGSRPSPKVPGICHIQQLGSLHGACPATDIFQTRAFELVGGHVLPTR